MKVLRKFLVILTAMIISILAFSCLNKTNAEPGGPIYLGIVSLRSSGYGYRQGGKQVWKIASYNSPSGGTADLSQMIYCIKAGPGFGSSDMSTGGVEKISTYNQKFNLKDLNSIESPYRDVLPTGENYNKLMWVLDHLYIIPEDGNETDKNNFLKSVISTERYDLLTNDEIDVIQQLAIWYFTNPTGEYHYEDIELYRNRLQGQDSDYKTFEDLLGEDGWDKQDAASALYDYFIDNADGSYVSVNASTSPISLDDSNAGMIVSGNNIIAGPFTINELLDIDYELTATYTNQNNEQINPSLGIKNSTGNVVTTNKSLKELVGQEFYLIVPASTNTTKIKMTINTSYSNKEITYWSVANAPNTEQPVVIITDKDYNFKNETEVSLTQGSYNLKLVKVDKDDNRPLSGAKFSVTINNGEPKQYTTEQDGSIVINDIQITNTDKDTITIQEIDPPDGYNSIIGTLTVEVEKAISDGKYVVTNVQFTSSTNPNGSTIGLDGSTITVTVPNEKVSGSYKLQLIKKDADADINLEGAVFSVKINNGEAVQYKTDNSGSILIDNISITEPGTDTITIEEITPPAGYSKMIGTIILNVTKVASGGSYVVSNIEFAQGSQGNGSTAHLEGGVITVTIPNKKQGGSYNLQLIKEDKENHNKLAGAVFNISVNGQSQEYITDNNGLITISNIQITEIGTDIITIEEVTPPAGYNSLIDRLVIEVTKSLSGGEYVASGVQFAENSSGEAHVDLNNGLITVTVPNEKKEGVYNLQLIKEDKNNHNKLSGAVFSVTVNNGEAKQYTTNQEGSITIDPIDILSEGIDTITIQEITPPAGYNSVIGTLTIEVTKQESNGEFVVSNAQFTDDTNTQGSTINLQNGLITVTIPNEKQTGVYNLELLKVDSQNSSKVLSGAIFTVQVNDGEVREYTTDQDGRITIDSIAITEEGIDTITIEEIQAPEGYNKIIGTLKVNVEKTNQDGEFTVSNAVFTEDTANTQESTVTLNGNTITVTVPNGYFDLSLRKFITGVNDEQITNRIPQVDVSTLVNGSSTTAIYNHTKNPISVAIGDTVIYTIRVYNEGTMDGYVNEITDHLPEQLEFLPDHEINTQYRWVQDENDPRTIRTDYLSRANEQTAGANKLSAFNGQELDYRDVQIACKVVLTSPMPEKITNIADISDFSDESGNKVIDRDSQEDNVELPTDEDLPNYKDDEINQNYVPGQQDDDDFEKLILKEFDLSLRKFITKVNDNVITNRIPQVDVTPLVNGTGTTAIYNHTKEPVKVTIGSVVEYTIRVYNEGQVDGYATEIKDHIPEQLEFLPDNSTNQEYRWVMLDENGNVTQNVEEAVAIRTDYLSKENEQTEGENKLEAFNGSTLDYRDVKVAFRVKQTDEIAKKITNIADISDYTDEDGNKVPDRDSEEDNVEIPSDEDLPNYKDDEINQDYVPGQQDDDDFEKVEIAEFDLSLRKFITAVNDSEITNRIPQVDVTPLIDGSGTTAIYNHPKDPVLVSNGNIVTYTIRVYNEGEVAGYASRIKDDIPEGLEFLPDNEINQEYRWVMLDENGNVTENLDEAVALETDYLSKEQEQEEGENLIAAFDGEELDYRDVKIAFKVIEPNTSDRILINKAQISEDTDENGNDVVDRDSIPDEWNEGEDDQDIEKVKVQYFDLSLRKWVTQAIVNKKGEETVIETGHKAEDDPEEIVAVDLKDSEIATTTVKFKYSIRVTNEGTIAGYAKEIKDYIPDGLIFVPEDNPEWTQNEDGTIVTTQAQDILLEPGQSTEVEVILTWDKEKQNFGVMDNWAEISKDYNDFGSPDIDSTPNNNKHGEDDIDDAPVLVSVKTGEAQIYVLTTLSVLGMLGTGLTLIKKFVL